MLTAYPKNDKEKYLARVRKHRMADELIRGTGWDGHRGCSVGCTIHCYEHDKYAKLLGVPEVLARIQEHIFERIDKDHLLWPERFLSAIKPGSDLSGVFPKFASRMLRRCVGYCGTGNEPWRVRCRAAIESMIAAFDGALPDEEFRARAAGAAGAAGAAEIQQQADDLIELIQQAPAASGKEGA